VTAHNNGRHFILPLRRFAESEDVTECVHVGLGPSAVVLSRDLVRHRGGVRFERRVCLVELVPKLGTIL
jgi:hypothetical protein